MSYKRGRCKFRGDFASTTLPESYWGQLRADYGLDKINVLAFEAGNEVYINNPKYTKPWFDDRVSLVHKNL